MRRIAPWLVGILVLVAITGCGGRRLEVERSDELDRLLAMHVTVSISDLSPEDALWAAFEAAQAPITQMSGGSFPDVRVSLVVHDQPLAEVIRLIYQDRLADLSFACSKKEFAVRSSHAAHERMRREWEREQRQVEAARRRMTAAVKQCDTIEIAVLGPGPMPDPSDTRPRFPIAAYESEVPIVRVHRLSGDADVVRLRTTLVALLSSREPGNWAFCHHPGFGLRCYRDGKLALETSFCWSCGNYHVVLAGKPQFLAIPGDHTGPDLKQALTAIAGAVTEIPGP